MNLNNLEDKLNNIKSELNNDNLNTIIKNLYNSNIENPIHDINIKNQYYSTLNDSEKIYTKKNDEYKKLISQYSQAYLDICDFYVGPELYRETFLDSKYDIQSLYFLFIMSLFIK